MNNHLSVSNRSARFLLAALILLTTLLTSTTPANAASLTVTTLDDELNADGDCSLREAIQAANTDIPVDACTPGSGTDSISIPTGTITLTSQLPSVTTTLIITGSGAANTILQANANPNTATYRVLAVGFSGNLTLDGLTVRHGVCDGSCSPLAESGGGILNAGTLTVTNSTFSGNSATFTGGAIENIGTLTVTNSTFSGNSARWGGAIGNHRDGTSTVTNCTFSGNNANRGGGGINNDGTATVTNSIFSENGAESGGGIRNTINNGFTPGLLTVINSTFSGNNAEFGGAILNDGGTLTVTDSTFSGNSTTLTGGGAILNLVGTSTITNSTFSGNSSSHSGGAIENVFGTLTVTNSTFSKNSASETGGAIKHASGSGDVLTVINSTFSGNSATQGGGIFSDSTLHLSNAILANSPGGGDCFNTGTLATNVNNLIEDGSCSPALSGDPNLGPLQDNGGLTHTMALGAGSPAIDAGDDTACPATDQRGVARPQGPHCDIGAFEVEVQSTYPFTGFFSPVDNLPTLNTVKAGQAIPVKFSLGGDQGLDIFAAGYPKVQQIACEGGAPSDAIEETVTSGSSGLQYDPASDTYTYVWKTQKSWAGTCRQLIVKLDDGTEHVANFKFK